jgi:hypothetical protein
MVKLSGVCCNLNNLFLHMLSTGCALRCAHNPVRSQIVFL